MAISFECRVPLVVPSSVTVRGAYYEKISASYIPGLEAAPRLVASRPFELVGNGARAAFFSARPTGSRSSDGRL